MDGVRRTVTRRLRRNLRINTWPKSVAIHLSTYEDISNILFVLTGACVSMNPILSQDGLPHLLIVNTTKTTINFLQGSVATQTV